MEPLIKIDNVSLAYDKRLILRNVSAEIVDIESHGQVIGFLGPSGIGKSQLSRVIAGLQRPTVGEVFVESKPTYAGRVGMVDQKYTLFDWATVDENLHLGGRLRANADFNDKYDLYLEHFGLREFLKMYPCDLSGGTRQRVAIAQQLLCSENFIVMDEPFSGLDLVMKDRACELISKVASLDTKNTIIVVTHDVTEAASIADTLWLMGYERDGMKWVEGATLVEKLDLAKLGFAWQQDIRHRKDFIDFVDGVKLRFKSLKGF